VAGVPVVPLREILSDAFAQRYGVPAINVFNDLTMEGVLAAAVESRSPLIVQTSVKTVKSIGGDVLFAMWTAMTAGIEVPVTLHLDHCPERAVITECLDRGWNSVLFDASNLDVAENTRQTVEVVAEARRHGADVEGEIEAITASRTASVPTRRRAGWGCGPHWTFWTPPGWMCSRRRSATRMAAIGALQY
jgi:fructose/tagatose bisphosphate aldolase